MAILFNIFFTQDILIINLSSLLLDFYFELFILYLKELNHHLPEKKFQNLKWFGMPSKNVGSDNCL